MSQRILNYLDVHTCFTHPSCECVPQSVTTETREENSTVWVFCQFFIVAVSDNASNCLVQRSLMLAFTKTVDEDEVRVTVHRYRAMNPGFLLIGTFLFKGFLHEVHHRNGTNASFCFRRVAVEVATFLASVVLTVVVVDERVIDGNRAFLKVNITPTQTGGFTYAQTRSQHNRENRIPVLVLRCFGKVEVSESLGGITEKKTLSKLDVKTAEIDPLIDITDYGLYSACGDCFIVYRANESEQHFYYLYPGYDTTAVLASTPFYSNETSKTGAFVSVDTLFEYDYQTASLKMRNLLTGEEKCFDCSPYAEQPDDEHRPDCRGPYGKYLLYETSYVSKEGYFLPHYRVLNLENGEFSEEMNLKDSQGNFLTSLTVVKDQFCVVYDYTSVNIAVADDNTMENVLIPKYALLSQDDYFHSRDNFHPISNDSF